MSATGAFEGRTALVTGAAGEIGAAIAAALAERGARVALVGRRRNRLELVARQLPESRHPVYEVDLTSDRAVRSLVRSVLRRFGKVDVLVHSNGVYASGRLDQRRITELDRLWAANVRSPLLLTQLLLPSLTASRGEIVFVNSSVGLVTRPGVGMFSATQHALHALADTIRWEVNEQGVRVLSVYPGRTATGRQARIFANEGRPYQPERLLQPGDLATIIMQSLTLPRTAEVTDIQIRPALKF